MKEELDIQLRSLSREDRIALLKGHSMKVVNEYYEKYLSPEEISASKEKFTEDSIKARIKIEKFKEIEGVHKAEMKVINEELNENLHIIRNGSRTMLGDLFYIDDQENKRMYIYNEDGELIDERALRPDERQTRMSIGRIANG